MMGENSKIQWTDHTFNSHRGCTKVSPGCANCYAETMSARNPGVLGVWGPNGTRVVAAESKWREPLKWNRDAAAAGVRKRVFCASLGDVFEDWKGLMVDAKGEQIWTVGGLWGTGYRYATTDEPHRRLTMDDVRRRLFDLIDATPHLDWLLLTKRPENIARMLPTCKQCETVGSVRPSCTHCRGAGRCLTRRNVWLGTSVENQAAADERIPHLLRVPAAVRFLSVEPLMGPVTLDLAGIHWVIVGGESGPGARPCRVEWVRGVVNQCSEAGVACFVKQMGASYREDRAGGDLVRIHLNDKKGGDPAEWPHDLRVREWPEVRS